MPGQTGPALFVLQGQHGLVRFWPGTVQFDLQCKHSRQQEASWPMTKRKKKPLTIWESSHPSSLNTTIGGNPIKTWMPNQGIINDRKPKINVCVDVAHISLINMQSPTHEI